MPFAKIEAKITARQETISKEERDEGMKANYHTHTRWCNHGTGEIEDYIKAAICGGLRELAITEHVPRRDNLDHRRIQWEEFEAYNRELDEMIDKYRGQIRVIKGFECEYYPEDLDDYRMFRDQYGYRLLILGQHRSGKNKEIDHFAKKTAKEMQLYADEVCAGLETGIFTFLAHPDLALQGYPSVWDETCERVMRQIYSACEKYNIPVEINGNGFGRQRAYPSKEALLLSKEYRLRYLINSDAHKPENLCGEVVAAVEAFAESLGIPVMEYLDPMEQL